MFLFFTQNMNMKAKQKKHQVLPVVTLAAGALGGGGFFGLWKHTDIKILHKRNRNLLLC